MTDNHIVFGLYVPIGIMILLMLMTFFHRRHVFKYLYLINLVCMLSIAASYFILRKYPAGYYYPGYRLNVLIFILQIVRLGGYILSMLSVVAFVVEHAERYLWARVVIGVVWLLFVSLCLWGIHLFIQGILSLNSG